jgi:hypothetical protein
MAMVITFQDFGTESLAENFYTKNIFYKNVSQRLVHYRRNCLKWAENLTDIIPENGGIG